MTIETILSEKVLAEKLNVTPGALAKWRVAGTGPAFTRIGRRIGYRPGDVEAWLDARRVASTSELAA